MKGVLNVFIRSCILEYKTYLYVYTISRNGGLKKKLLQKYTNFEVSFLYNMFLRNNNLFILIIYLCV